MKSALFELADIASCMSSNIHQLHFNVVGAEFGDTHKLLEKYYEELNDDYDAAGEWGRALGGFAPSSIDSGARIQMGGLEPKPYSTEEALTSAHGHLETYVTQLTEVFNAVNQLTDPLGIAVTNWIQGRIEYWAKEVAFFISARLEGADLEEGTPEVIEGGMETVTNEHV
jgi:DNA-binding ferritin-like protein